MKVLGLLGLVLVLAGLTSCQVPTSATPTPTPTVQATPVTATYSSTSSPVLPLVSADATASQNVSVTVNLGSSSKHLDLIFTNESGSSTASMPSVVGDSQPVVARAVTPSALPALPPQLPRAVNAPPAIVAANEALARSWRTQPSRALVAADSAPTTGYTVGKTTETYIPPSSEAGNYPSGTDFTCTLRAVVQAPALKRTLFVWVANNSWDTQHPDSGGTGGYDYVSGDPYPFKVNTAMVAKLAAAFLNGSLTTQTSAGPVTTTTGTSGVGDIYGYDTSIFGNEYFDQGDTNFANYQTSGLITPQGEIHIFILPLNPGAPSTQGDGGTLGYFYAVDNFQQSIYSDSNQKIMFQLDSQMLANTSISGNTSLTPSNIPTQGWSAQYSLTTPTVSYWPNQMLSTLAHEFQHMIHFYQKQVLQNAAGATQTWLNEMCSMVTEDFVASSLGTIGPRGVPETNGLYTYAPGSLPSASGGNDPGSRLAFFNNSYTLGVENWDTNDPLASYGVSYAFGAWLARNYGGPQLFHDIVDSSATTDQAVVSAVNSLNGLSGSSALTMPQLVEQWAATMLLGPNADQGVPYELSAPTATPPYAFTPASIQDGPGAAQTFTYGSLNPDDYYPISDSTNSFTSSSPGPLVYSTLTGVTSLPPLAFYYYAVHAGASLSGSVNLQVTLPPNVELQAVVLP